MLIISVSESKHLEFQLLWIQTELTYLLVYLDNYRLARSKVHLSIPTLGSIYLGSLGNASTVLVPTSTFFH